LLPNVVSLAFGPKISNLYLLRMVFTRLTSDDWIMIPFLVGIILEMLFQGTYFRSCCMIHFGAWYLVSKIVNRKEFVAVVEEFAFC